jgi:hypothetical protein
MGALSSLLELEISLLFEHSYEAPTGISHSAAWTKMEGWLVVENYIIGRI